MLLLATLMHCMLTDADRVTRQRHVLHRLCGMQFSVFKAMQLMSAGVFCIVRETERERKGGCACKP